MKSVSLAMLQLCLTAAACHAAAAAAPAVAVPDAIQSYNIDFNWGPGGPNGFAKPGLWAEADPAQHVAWYKALGCNVIQTFCVSCNGYAWYKNGVVPEQPGLKHDFLTEMVKLAHQDNMLVLGYFCAGSNTRWGQTRPDLSYGFSSNPHIPYTDEYLAYLDGAIRDVVKKTGIDGFMVDWLRMPTSRESNGNRWLDCEKKLYSQLMGEAFPGEDKLTEAQMTAYGRKAIDRCWGTIRKAAKETNPACLVWLTCCDINDPHIANSRALQETDWLLNEAGDLERTAAAKKMIGPQTRMITCLAAWNNQNPDVVIPAARKAGIGLYGFTKPTLGNLKPPVASYLEKPLASLQGDERNIAALARTYLGLAQDAVQPPSAVAAAAVPPVHPALLPLPATLEWRDGVMPKDGALRMEQVAGLPAEGYELEIAPTGAVIRSSAEAGAFYAQQTLQQLRGADGSLPCVLIRDAPRFAWRGLMLDSSRHFQTVDDIKRWLDLLAMHKLNVFHWHLVDDHGWRFESKKFPLLTQIGAWREQPPIGRYGGFFTQQEMREVVAYAAKRHITVLPEIEMPGHSRAALAAYPNLACGGTKTEVDHFFDFPMSATRFPGVPGNNVFCAGNEDTYRMLEAVLAEVMEIFPGKYIHCGGDEVPLAAWNGCKDCQATMKAKNLADGHKLQAHFMGRIETFLMAHGRKMIGWDEILEGGLTPAATVMSWRGTSGGVQAAKAGHDAVMSPEKPLYFDHRQSASPLHPPGFGGSIETLQEIYQYDPVPKELTPQQASHILGTQANLWSCATDTTERLELFAFPRLCALAEIAWCAPAAKDYSAFQQRLAGHLPRLEALGVNYWRDDTAEAAGVRLYAPEQPLPDIRATTPVTQDRDKAIYDWAQRHQQVLEQLKTNKPEVVMIGDSITHYWAGAPAAPLVRGAEAWQQAFGAQGVANLGFGWDRTENVLWRIAHGELDGIDPKLVIVLIGTNNLDSDTAAQILAGVDAICRKIHEKLPAARIVQLGLLPRKDQGQLMTDLDKVNYLLQTRLHPRPYVDVLDLGNQFRNADGTLNESLFSDGLHPNAAGYAILGKALATLRDAAGKPK